ncbi:hypothetical protein ACO0QE_002027 [Hanseniaspora vineae]
MSHYNNDRDSFDDEGDYSMNQSSTSEEDYSDRFHEEEEELEDHEHSEYSDHNIQNESESEENAWELHGNEDDDADEVAHAIQDENEFSMSYSVSGDTETPALVGEERLENLFGTISERLRNVMSTSSDRDPRVAPGTTVHTFELPRAGRRPGEIEGDGFGEALLRMLAGNMNEGGRGTSRSNPGANDNNSNDAHHDAERINDVFAHLLRNVAQHDPRTRVHVGGSGMHSRQEYTTIVLNIEKAEEDPYLALESLKKISTDILLMPPHILDSFVSLKNLTEKVVHVMKSETLKDHAELQLQASQCLENVFSADEETIFYAVATLNFLQVLKNALQDMTFIDLAEQNLALLNIVSDFCCRSVLKIGIVQDVYNFIDFFPLHAQSKFLDTVSNCLTRPRATDIEYVSQLSTLVTNMSFSNLHDKSCFAKCVKIYYNICANFPKKTYTKLIDMQVPVKMFEHFSAFKNDIDSETSLKILSVLTALLNSSSQFLQTILDQNIKISMFFNEFITIFKKREESTLVDILPSIPASHLRGLLKLLIAVFSKEKVASEAKFDEHGVSIINKNENDNEDFLINYANHAAEICSNFGQNSFDFLDDCFPLIVQILSHTQDELASSYCLSLINIYLSVLAANGQAVDITELSNLVAVLSSKAYALEKTFTENFDEHHFETEYSIRTLTQIFNKLLDLNSQQREKILTMLKHEGLPNLLLSLYDTSKTSSTEDSDKITRSAEEEASCVQSNKFEFLTFESWMAIQKFLHPEKFETTEMCEKQKGKYKKKNGRDSNYDYYGDADSDSYGDSEDYEAMLESGVECTFDANVDLSDPIYKVSGGKKLLEMVNAELKLFKSTYEKLGVEYNDEEHQQKLQSFVKRLNQCDVSSLEEKYWSSIWAELKGCLHNRTGETLSFSELIESNILSTMVQVVKNAPKECITSLVDVLGEDSMAALVGLLHNCIDRFETFEQPYLFNLSNVKHDFEKLSEPLRIEMKYCDESEAEEAPKTLKSFYLNVQPLIRIELLASTIKDLWVKNILKDGSLSKERREEFMKDSEKWDFTLCDSSLRPLDPHLTALGQLIKDADKAKSTSGQNFNWSSVSLGISWAFRKTYLPQSSGPSVLQEKEHTKRSAFGTNYAHRFDAKIELSSNIADSLELMSAIGVVNSYNNCDSACFINNKLTTKLHLQLSQPLVTLTGLIPDWVFYMCSNYPMVFTYEAREKLMTDTCRGTKRLIKSWVNELFGIQENNTANENNIENLAYVPGSLLWRMSTINTHKIVIDRKNMFQQALTYSSSISDPTNILSVKYTNEKGEGSGPTREFYSIISKMFTKKSLGMWRGSFDSSVLEKAVKQDDFVVKEVDLETEMETAEKHTTVGQNKNEDTKDQDESQFYREELFPQPLVSAEKNNDDVATLFKFLGTFLARSLLDLEMVDFRFNEVFFQILNSYVKNSCENKSQVDLMETLSIPDGIDLITKLDKGIGNSFRYIYEQGLRNTVNETGESKDLLESNIPYNLPGYDSFVMSSSATSADEYVSNANYENYLKTCINVMLFEGILPCLQNFLDGFNRVLPYKALLFLTPKEASLYFGKTDEDWSFETISKSLNADHGYTMESNEVVNLINIMTNLSKDERRLFLQFATSSPRLPLGGFQKLRPKLLIALKPPADNCSPDNTLPSVMTCVNYFKLPQYSDIDIMRKRILQAITEGSGEFSFT